MDSFLLNSRKNEKIEEKKETKNSKPKSFDLVAAFFRCFHCKPHSTVLLGVSHVRDCSKCAFYFTLSRRTQLEDVAHVTVALQVLASDF